MYKKVRYENKKIIVEIRLSWYNKLYAILKGIYHVI